MSQGQEKSIIFDILPITITYNAVAIQNSNSILVALLLPLSAPMCHLPLPLHDLACRVEHVLLVLDGGVTLDVLLLAHALLSVLVR